MSHTLYLYTGIALLTLISVLTRVLPFMFARQLRSSPHILQLGRQLPVAIMLLLVLYTLRDNSLISYPFALPEILAVSLVLGVQMLLHREILSLFIGTVAYLLLQWVMGI